MRNFSAMSWAMAVAVLLVESSAVAQTPAFPGAEGEGMYVTGGRGGDVYHVTNLNNTGTGSLRNGIATATGARTIVFDISGTISLNSTLRVDKSNITIAGQTAPGMGILIRNYGVYVGNSNVILRHIRIRPGDAMKGPSPGFYGDALELKNSNIIVDHCSTSWGIDESTSSAGAGFNNLTVQYCTISQGLDQTGLYHDVWDANYAPGGTGHHGYGSLIKPISGNGVASFHHNLWAMNRNRNPAVGTYGTSDTLKADIRNNVIYNNYNNGYSSGASLRVDMNYVGNYIIAGPETDDDWLNRAFNSYAANHMYIYQSGNKIDSDLDTVHDGNNTNWGMFSGTYSTLATPVSMKSVTTQSADDAYNTVLAQSGAFYWNRDSVDANFISNVQNQTGQIIDSQNEAGGYPTIPSETRATDWDTDNDGMPNTWEQWYGTNPAVADHNGNRDGDGYRDLEEYLVWIYDPNSIHHAGDTNGDDNVGLIDLGRLAANWNISGGWEQGDFNGSGLVDLTDLGCLAANWNWAWTGAPPAEVPEPGTLSLLVFGPLAMLWRRKRNK